MFAAPHGLSQRTTSFIACACQGIHRTPLRHLIALIINARSRDQRTEIRGQKGSRPTAPPPPLPLRPDGIAAPRLERHGASNPSPSRQRVRPAPDTNGPEQVLKDQCHTRTFRRPRRSSFSQLTLIPGPLKAGTSGKSFSSRCQQTGSGAKAATAAKPFLFDKPGTRPAPPGCRIKLPVEPARSPAAARPRGRTKHQSGWRNHNMVEPDGIEPTTSCLQSRRSPN